MAKISIVSRKIHHLITTLYWSHIPSSQDEMVTKSRRIETVTKKWSIRHMMNVDLLLNQEIKYIIPIWKKA